MENMNDNNQMIGALMPNEFVNLEKVSAEHMESNEPRKRAEWLNTSLVEKIAAVAIFPISYAYSNFAYSIGKEMKISFGIFVICFMALAEAMFFKRKRTVESWIFLVLTIVAAVSGCFTLSNVWGDGLPIFFTHLFAAYWVLCRSDRLAEGETSHMFLWDGITAFFVMTFKNIHQDIRAIISIFARSEKEEGKKRNVWGALIGIVLGIILLCIAVSCLKKADDNFGQMMDTVANVFRIEVSFDFVLKCVTSIFFAMYFYGLLGGCYRETTEHVVQRGNNIKKVIAALKKVPGVIWVILIGFFTVFYLLFFGLQGSYLFDAFSMTLPTQYTFSEYARKGFGDMCGVMVVNLIVTWLSTRTGFIGENKGLAKAVKIAVVILTIESTFFAVIAGLKLLMYINAYGFTPLRLQSAWLVVVLAYACVCILISVLGGKKTAKYWFIGSSVSLAALCLV